MNGFELCENSDQQVTSRADETGVEEHNPGRRNLKRPKEVVKDMRDRDPRKGNSQTADNVALYPSTVERAVPLRLNKKVKDSAISEMESEDDRRQISVHHIP